MCFKNLEGKPERESLKRPISAGSGLKLLQMVLEPDTGRCVSEETEPRRKWTRGGVLARTLAPKGLDWRVPHRLKKGTSASEDAGPRRGVDCEIPCRLERRTKHSL